MSCSNCNNGGCGGCGRANASQIILNPVSAGARPCSPLGGACGTSQPSTPTPFYECAPQCQENHCQEIVYNFYSAAVCTQYAFNMPDCSETVNVYFIDVKSLPVGSYLWDDLAGYLEVTAFNNQTGLATLLNNCNEGNAAAGTNIPACTCFTVQAPPCCNTEDPTDPFLAVDFTAPADADCTTITVTSVAGLSEGDTIALGTGLYLLDDIISPTTITICNQGEGITPGTVVEARNEAGQLQYPIVSVTNCCDNLREELDQKSDSEQSASVSDTLTVDEDSAETVPIVLTFTNSSTTNSMIVTGIFGFYGVVVSLGALAAYNFDIQLSEDGGPYTGFLEPEFVATSPYQVIQGSAELEMSSFSFSNVYTLTPGATLTIGVKGIMRSQAAPDIQVKFFVKGSLVGTAI